MNLPDDILLTIFLSCDSETLLKVSRIPILSGQVARIVSSDLFFVLSFEKTCWKTTCRAVAEYTKRTRICQHYISGSHSASCMTLTAAKILLLVGYKLNEGNNRALELACRQNDVELVSYLIQFEAVLKTEAGQTTSIIAKSIRACSYDVVQVLCNPIRTSS